MDKKFLFVIGSTIVVIILAAIWGYLLFFSAPGTPGTFTDFNFGNQTESVAPPLPSESESESEEPTVNLQGSKLRQLTTRPVAGYRELMVATTSPRVVRYVEAGTGHVYEINLATGQEERVSGTTLAMTSEAIISPDGTVVLARSGQGSRSTVHIGSFVGTTTTALTFTQLTGQVIDFDITKAGELLVAVTTDGGVTATERNVTGAVLQTLFTVPFREVQILWGEQANATHYLYPKPTRFLEGALFATDGTRLERLPIDGFGLSATAQAETIIFGKSDGGEYKNTISNTGETMILPLSSTLPEKCYIHDAEIAYCASSPAAPVSEQLPDSWHQGVYQTNDWLWKVNLTLGTAQALSNLEAESGRTIDAFALQSTANNSAVYFINKNNLTLWTYDLQ